ILIGVMVTGFFLRGTMRSIPGEAPLDIGAWILGRGTHSFIVLGAGLLLLLARRFGVLSSALLGVGLIMVCGFDLWVFALKYAVLVDRRQVEAIIGDRNPWVALREEMRKVGDEQMGRVMGEDSVHLPEQAVLAG